MILAPIVIGLTARLNLNPDFGLIGIMLRDWGIAPTGVISSGRSAFLTIVAMDIWQWTPFLVMVFFAAIVSMPRDPFEAAEVEGALIPGLQIKTFGLEHVAAAENWLANIEDDDEPNVPV